MPAYESILDLLAEWSAARKAGRPLSAEQLCRDRPELLVEVRQQIKMLEAMRWLEEPTEASDRRSSSENSPASNSGEIDTVALGPMRGDRTPRAGTLVRYVGDYELLEEIARGGMGVVYKARQVRLKRVVALKMILAGDFASPADVQRFHTEAESAAQLDHPNIVPVFEVGEHQGLHYFSMGFVDGASLSARLAGGPLPPREAAELLRKVCQAVQYAHDKGVIHRDLKPGNILIDKLGEPRVTDFGLAKRTSAGASDLTGTGQILGTPSYMPPEQALGQPNLVRESADIYALGAVLYATLTGRPPFQADNPLDTLRQVLEREPVPPRQLNPAIPLDLETICLKCLEKSASRRYATAQDAADELGRFLEGKPILARPVNSLNRAWRWCKRNRVVASLLAAVFVSLVAGITASSFFAAEEAAARDKAEENARGANLEAANLALNQAETHCKADEANVGLLWMAKAHRLAIEARDADLTEASRAMISGWLNHVPRLNRVEATPPSATFSRFGPNDESLIMADSPTSGYTNPGKEQGLVIQDIRTNRQDRQISGVRCAGLHLAVNRDRTQVLLLDEQQRVRIWSLADRKWVGQEIKPTGSVHEAVFSDRNQLLATATEKGVIEFWSASDGTPTGIRIDTRQPEVSFYIFCLAFDPSGRTLWSAGNDRLLRHWDVRTGMEIGKPVQLSLPGRNMEISKQGRRLAVSLQDGLLRVFSIDGEPKETGAGRQQLNALDLDYSPAGDHVVEAGYSNQVIFHDGKSGAVVGAPATFACSAVGVQFDRSGSGVLVGNMRSIEIWDCPGILADSRRRSPLPSQGLKSFRDESGMVWQMGRDGFLVREKLPNRGVESPTLLPKLSLAPAIPSQNRLIGTTEDGRVVIADFATGKLTVSTHQHLPAPLYLAVAPHGNRLLTLNEQTVQLWELPTGKALGAPWEAAATLRNLSFTDDGRLFAIFDQVSKLFRLRRTDDGSAESEPVALGPNADHAMLTRDGRNLIVARGNAVEIWDRLERRHVKTLGSHDELVRNAALSPDGKHCVTCGNDRTLRTWNLQTGEMVGTPMRNVGKEVLVAFSPDGTWLASCGFNEQLKLWHLRTGRWIAAPFQKRFAYPRSPRFRRQDESMTPFAFSADSRHLIDLTSATAYCLPPTPNDHEQLALQVETWTGLTLEGNDVRVLLRDEWQRRHDKLATLGWHDEPSALQPEPYQPPPEMKEPIVIESGIDNLSRIVFSGDGKFLATSSSQQTKIWDAATQNLVQEFQNSGSLAICLTRDGKQLFTGGGAGLRWWNVETGKLEQTKKFEDNVIDIALSPDEQFLAIAQMRSRTVHVLRRETGELVQAFELPINRPAKESKAHSQASFSPDGKLLVVVCGGRAWPDFVGEDSAIAVWEVDSWKLRTSFTADKYSLVSLEISPDCEWIAAASHGGKTAKLWKMPSGSEADTSPAREFAAHNGRNAVAFSPDGKLLAHSSHTPELGTVVLERLDTGRTIVVPTFDGAYDVAFSPDGKQLATGSRNGTVSLWNVNDLSGAAGNNSQPGKPVIRP